MHLLRRLQQERSGHGHPVHPEVREHAQIELEAGSSRRIGSRDGERRSDARLLQRLASLAFVLVLGVSPQALAAEPTVILLSWDGIRHDYPERAQTPGLDRVERTGVRASRLVPVFPTKTFPNHVALATGTYVDRHGIVANVFEDRERGRFSYEADASWIAAEPIWIAAERQGVRAAVFFWVGSETDWRGRGASYRRTPFDPALPESAKVDQILAWLDLPPPERPQLILAYWRGADSAGHRHGPNHTAVVEQLEAQDRQLERLLAGIDERGLWEATTLLVVSDHGMAEVSELSDPIAPLLEQGIGGRFVGSGGVGFVHLEELSQSSQALAILNAQPGLEAHLSEALPAELRSRYPSRTGDIVVIATPPRALSVPSLQQRALLTVGRWLGFRRGSHGYRPDHPDMGAIFYATGRGIPRGMELGALRAIDIAATVAALLRIEPPAQSEGTPMPGLALGVGGARTSGARD